MERNNQNKISEITYQTQKSNDEELSNNSLIDIVYKSDRRVREFFEQQEKKKSKKSETEISHCK